MNVNPHEHTPEEFHRSLSPNSRDSRDDEDDGVWGDAATPSEKCEASSLQDLMTELRSQIQRCRLPPLDVAAIDKYIFRVLRHGRPHATEGAARCTKHVDHTAAISSYSLTDKMDYSSNSTSQAFSQGDARACAVTLHARDHNSNIVCEPPVHMHSAPTPLGVRSRHAALYASVYGCPDEAINVNSNASDITGRERVVPLHSRNGNMCQSGRNGTTCKLGESFVPRRSSQEVNSEDDPSASDSECDVQSYEAAITDMLQLRHVLSKHEATICVVLAAVERREAIMSRLRSFLKMASADVLSADATGGPFGEILTTKDANSSSEVMPVDSSRDSPLHPWARQRPSRKPPLRLASTSLQTVTNSQRLKVSSRKRRYYVGGVLYLFRRLQWASVELVEGVRRWRKQLSCKYPFVVDGCNYLLKMVQEMAALASDMVLQILFPSPEKRREASAMRMSDHGATATPDDSDQDVVTLPGSLQFYPLMTNIPHLTECHRPVTPDDLTPFDFGEHDTNSEAMGAIHTTTPKERRAQQRSRVHRAGKLPLDVIYARRVQKAEDILHAEVAVQMQLIKRQFLACSRGMYPLVLRGVGVLSGSRDGMLRLESRHLRREWYWRLRDMLHTLEEGSSVVRKE